MGWNVSSSYIDWMRESIVIDRDRKFSRQNSVVVLYQETIQIEASLPIGKRKREEKKKNHLFSSYFNILVLHLRSMFSQYLLITNSDINVHDKQIIFQSSFRSWNGTIKKVSCLFQCAHAHTISKFGVFWCLVAIATGILKPVQFYELILYRYLSLNTMARLFKRSLDNAYESRRLTHA